MNKFFASQSGVAVKLLLSLGVLAIAVECTVVALNHFALPLESAYYHNGETEWVRKLPHKPKVLFMGSSTILFGVDPQIVAMKLGLDSGEVINLAGAGFTPMHSLHAWKSISSELDSVKYVYYGLDSWLFSERKFQRDDYLTLLWSLPQRVWIATHPKSFHPYVRNYCLTGIPWLHVMLTTFARPMVSNPDIPVGFGAQTKFLRAWDPWTVPSKDMYPEFLFPLSDVCFDRLRELRDSVEKHGAQLIFVLPPKHRLWLQDYATNCAAFDSLFISRMNREIGSYPVIGSFRMFDDVPDSTVLLDFVHLNKAGQARFSAQIADTIHRISVTPLARAPIRALWTY